MIYTVTFNPSLDYIVGLDQLNIGMVNRTKSEVVFPGGKGVNVSLVLHNMGIESRALVFIGGFTGREFEARLKEKGIQTDFIAIESGNTRINVKLRAKEETEVNGQGPDIKPEDIAKLYAKLDELNDYFRNITGNFDVNALKHCTGESEATLKNYKDDHTFILPDGSEEIFSFHLRFTGTYAGRIFFISDEENRSCIIGHIGKKLKSVKYH